MGPGRRSTLLVATLALVLSACGGGGGTELRTPDQQARGAQAINAQDPATLQDGGDLRLPLDSLPSNYNYNHIDGHEGATREVLWALMPRVFNHGIDGGSELNTDYVTSAELTSMNPQVVTYRINPAATWDTGRPITWEDFEAQWRTENGSEPAYVIQDKTGYEDITAVERGADDKEVIVTFGKPFAEWQALFVALYPKESHASPEAFNTGWLQRPAMTAGPFTVESIDPVAKTIVLTRNENWWGAKPRLNRVIFTETDRAALPDRLANNEIDWYTIGSNINLYQRARTIPGVEIRQALEKQYAHITFNGAAGAILADKPLRQAIAQGIDRRAITQRLIGQILPDAPLQQHHIFPIGGNGYRDNSAFPFDQAAARRGLDALGWAPQGEVRVKDGTELNLRFIVPANNPTSDQTARIVLEQLSQIGVRVTIEVVPTADFFAGFVNRGNFDLTSFQWLNTDTPFSSSPAVYQEPIGDNVGGNYGRIYDPEISALFAEGLQEFDEAARIEIANRIDAMIWDEVHHIPLFPQTGAYATRSTLANWGAKGLGDWNYLNVGFMRQ